MQNNDFKDLSGEALKEAISKRIREKSDNLVGDMASQGTTPRQLTDLIGSCVTLQVAQEIKEHRLYWFRDILIIIQTNKKMVLHNICSTFLGVPEIIITEFR